MRLTLLERKNNGIKRERELNEVELIVGACRKQLRVST